MSADIDPKQIRSFADLLLDGKRAKVTHEEIWQAFASAFPGRPQGAEECGLLVTALQALAGQGSIALPRPGTSGWLNSLGIAIPRWVRRVRPAPAPVVRAWKTFPWHPRLAWVVDLDQLPPEFDAYLRHIHEGLVHGRFERTAPLKYRSLQLTGDEKRLEQLMAGSLFGEGRLDLELLGCLPDVPPMAWESISDSPRILIFENAGPFAVARAVLAAMPRPRYGMIGFGCGNPFGRSVRHLLTIGRPLAVIHYVGDLDRPGLRTARLARVSAVAAGLPPVEPATGLHMAMLRAAEAFGSAVGWPHDGAAAEPLPDDPLLASFLPDEVRAETTRILQQGRRIPEEVLGPDELQAAWAGE